MFNVRREIRFKVSFEIEIQKLKEVEIWSDF